MFAVASAILFAVALILNIVHQASNLITDFALAGWLCLALALIPAVNVVWRSR